MSRFLCLNLQDFSPGENITNIVHCSDILCVCCLDQNVPYINLSRCKHTSFFEKIVKIQIKQSDHLICYQCHAILKKIEEFRQQIEDSFNLLSSKRTSEIKSNKLRKSILERKVLESIDINNQSQTGDFSNSQITEIPISESAEDFNELSKVEVKLEEDFSNDELDYNIPLVYIKEEHQKIETKKKNKAVPKSNNTKKNNNKTTKGVLKTTGKKVTKTQTIGIPKVNKYEGKIKMITLTEEEMKAERIKDASNEKYLQLPFKCETCIVGFDYENTIKEHNEKKHNQKKQTDNFVCKICQSVMTTNASYKNHMRRHYKRYECMKCSKQYNNMYPMIKHYNDMHEKINDTLYKCAKCDFTSDNNRSYRYHIEKHKGKRQCAECGKTFVNSAGLKSHLYTVHARSRVFECRACDKQYRQRSGLVAHRLACHPAHAHGDVTPAPPPYCRDCRAHFKSHHIYRMHLKTHSRHRCLDDAEYQCDECGGKFYNKSSLAAHINYKHLNNTKYKCVVCDNRSFRNKHELTKHIDRVHNKTPAPRNKICDYCGRAFTCSQILRTHIRTHTGERPLRCPRCPASFAHPAALYTHNKLVHEGSLVLPSSV